jgi:hypothetical protein
VNDHTRREILDFLKLPLPFLKRSRFIQLLLHTAKDKAEMREVVNELFEVDAFREEPGLLIENADLPRHLANVAMGQVIKTKKVPVAWLGAVLFYGQVSSKKDPFVVWLLSTSSPYSAIERAQIAETLFEFPSIPGLSWSRADLPALRRIMSTEAPKEVLYELGLSD